MIQRINFSQNPNGKLFADTFSDVRLNDEKFIVHHALDVYLRGLQMGTVQIVAIRLFQYRQITDTISYVTWGKPAPYLAAMLRLFYKEQPLEPTTQLAHVVLQWSNRNMEAHTHALQEWWAAKDKDPDRLQNSNYKL